ncbi:MAG: hypothetical protein ACI9J3_000805 [Parvicellaceae bacterium]|jgi:hypothetical protein
MRIIEVKSSSEIKQFQKLPWFIYQDDSNWVPHLTSDVEKIFSPDKNKLFRNGKATRWILVDKDDKTIGRIGAFVNGKTKNSFKQPTGGVGFFECINDQDAANLILDTAKGWLISEGMEAMDGPINFGEKQEFWGLLIDNFDDPSSYMMNYNPSYYKTIFETYGFEIYYNQYIFKRDLYEPAQEIFTQKYERMKADPKYKITNVRGKSLDEIANDFWEVYNGAWGGISGFKAMPKPIAKKVVEALKPIMDPDIVMFVYYEDRPIAFYVNIPELNEIFKYVNGNLNFFNKLKVWYHLKRKTSSTMVGIVFGVVKDFQGKGIEGAMIKWTEENIVPLNRYNETILTWIGDFNPSMIKLCENLGTEKFRTLATYRYLFDRDATFVRCPIID